MSRLPTITDIGRPEEWLHNPHAGEMLLLEFMQPLNMSVSSLAEKISVHPDRIHEVISGRKAIDADTDLRLARYFRMSDGFFLGLQLEYELLEAKRAANGALDRIVPRAA